MADSVRVAVRVRPFNQREIDMKAKLILAMSGKQTTITNPENQQTKEFTFDFSYWSHDGFNNDENGVSVAAPGQRYHSQQDVYNDIGQDILNNAFEGYNCSLFAYGQTGAGKSYSMVGYGANKGIIPIICEQMFVRTTANTEPNVQYQITVSMLEIYNEQIKDLLSPKETPKGGLKLRSKPGVGNYVDALSQLPVATYAQVAAAMDEGTKNRTVASTKMNASSSRAHTVFTILFTKCTNAGGQKSEMTAKINLVDLAGSERAESTGATGDRLKEGSAINQSLSALGNVISALAEQSQGKKKVFVPYRNSVLTRLLQDALGGNSKTIMIAALSPADVNYDETMSTLRYADRAKQIKNAVVKNENPTERIIRELKEENDRLMKLLEGKGASSTGGAGGVDDNGEAERLRAQLQEQMRDNQRLMEEMQKSWEQKLKEAMERNQERAAEGGAMSVSQASASNLPHIINLHEDPQLSECVVYVFKEGETRIGRSDAPVEQDVVLSGLNIKKEHALVVNSGGKVTITALDSSKTFVNGDLITGPTQLQHRDRVILGNNFVFRFTDPQLDDGNGDADGKDGEESATTGQSGVITGHITWEKAMKEFTTKQGLRLQQDLSGRGRAQQEEDEKRKELEEKLKTMEEEIKQEREKAARALESQRHLFETQGGADGFAKLKAVEEEFARKNSDLSAELERRREMSQRIIDEQLKRKRETMKIESDLATLLPLVNEANSIAEELQRPVKLEARLVAKAPKGVTVAPDAELVQSLEISIRVTNINDRSVWNWSPSKFENRLFMMRELYEDIVSNGPRDIEPSQDPFWDPPEPVEIGKAYVFLKPLSQLVEIDQEIAIVDHKGAGQGQLKVEIVPEDALGSDMDYLGSSKELLGKEVYFRLDVPFAKDLPVNYSNDVIVSFEFMDQHHETKPYEVKTTDPQFNYSTKFHVPHITEEQRNYLLNDSVVFTVKGFTDAQSKAAQAALAAPPVIGSRPQCEQCEEQEAVVDCLDCTRAMCEACFTLLHKSAKKQYHNAVLIPSAEEQLLQQQQLEAAQQEDAMAEDVIMCGQCEEQSAVVVCHECDKHFCNDCNALLHKSAKRQAHNRQPLALSGAGRSRSAPPCSQCEEQVAALLCIDCERVFCDDCNELLHKSAKKRGHNRVPV